MSRNASGVPSRPSTRQPSLARSSGSWLEDGRSLHDAASPSALKARYSASLISVESEKEKDTVFSVQSWRTGSGTDLLLNAPVSTPRSSQRLSSVKELYRRRKRWIWIAVVLLVLVIIAIATSLALLKGKGGDGQQSERDASVLLSTYVGAKTITEGGTVRISMFTTTAAILPTPTLSQPAASALADRISLLSVASSLGPIAGASAAAAASMLGTVALPSAMQIAPAAVNAQTTVIQQITIATPAPASSAIAVIAPVNTPAAAPAAAPAPAPAPVPAAAPPPVAAPPPSSGNSQADILNAFNSLRSARGAGPLVWDTNNVGAATSFANACQEDRAAYSQGETEYAGPLDIVGAINTWASNNGQPYDYVNFPTGNYAQLFWKSSVRVACAQAACSYGNTVICRYDPNGNVPGQMAANVA